MQQERLIQFSHSIVNRLGDFVDAQCSDLATHYDAATVADAKNYIVSAVASKTVAASGADIALAFGSMTGTTSANTFLNSSWQAVAVPEPTSGLLMLVGLAGLALRRRRA